jgi:hypothetical protein
VLNRLRDLGVSAEARGNDLKFRPASLVPPDLVAPLRAHKADILHLLTIRQAIEVKERSDQMAPPVEPIPAPCLEELVARLAAVMPRTRPRQRVTNPERAAYHFQAQAWRRLEPLDPIARRLLVQAEQDEPWKSSGRQAETNRAGSIRDSPRHVQK